MTVVFIKAGTTSFEVPTGVTAIKVELLGPGGDGIIGTSGQRDGGGGGEYACVNALVVTPGETITCQVGAGGSQNDTWFDSTGVALANAGTNAASAAPGVGGTGGVGDVLFDGGDGGGSTSNGGGGGGGAAGPSGAGGDGVSVTGNGSGQGGSANNGAVAGGAPGASNGSTPGTAGTMQALWTQTSDSESAGPGSGGGGARGVASGNGGKYGAGGGGGGDVAGQGEDGIIILTYTAASGATGSFTGTDGADSGAFTGKVLVQGSMSGTEGADTGAFAGDVIVQGAFSGTDGADSAAFAGTVVVSGALAAVEGADTGAFEGVVETDGTTGSFTGIEGADSAAFTGLVVVQGSFSGTEGADSAAFTGSVPASGALPSPSGMVPLLRSFFDPATPSPLAWIPSSIRAGEVVYAQDFSEAELYPSDQVTTFARTGAAYLYRYDTDELLTFADGVPRITDLGLLLEGAETYQPCNSTMTGAAVGLVGSGGALPTGWAQQNHDSVEVLVADSDGITLELILDNTGGGGLVAAQLHMPFPGSVIIAAASGEVFTGAYVYTVVEKDPTDTITDSFLIMQARDASNVNVLPSSNLDLPEPVGEWNRQARAITCPATTDRVYLRWQGNAPAGTGILHRRVRIQYPTITKSTGLTSPVPTTNSGTVTRNADSFGLTLSEAAQTLILRFAVMSHQTASSVVTIASLSDGTSDEIARIVYDATDDKLYAQAVAGGVQQCSLDLGTVSLGAVHSVAFSWATNAFSASRDGDPAVTDTSGTAPSDLTELVLGDGGGGVLMEAVYALADTP